MHPVTHRYTYARYGVAQRRACFLSTEEQSEILFPFPCVIPDRGTTADHSLVFSIEWSGRPPARQARVSPRAHCRGTISPPRTPLEHPLQASGRAAQAGELASAASTLRVFPARLGDAQDGQLFRRGRVDPDRVQKVVVRRAALHGQRPPLGDLARVGAAKV